LLCLDKSCILINESGFSVERVFISLGDKAMNFRGPMAAGLLFAIAISGVNAAEPLKSGPEVGSKKIAPFHPLNVTGSAAGKPQCLV
jgi:hypothetical protein